MREALATLRLDNLRLGIVARNYLGDWNQKEKWYGTEYKYEKLPEDLMAEFEAALVTSAEKRIPELRLPHDPPSLCITREQHSTFQTSISQHTYN